jgi:hypothetical protein
MKDAQIKALGCAMASMLLSQASHSLAMGSLEGTGEITLRDGLTVAAAAEGARAHQAWIIEREVKPDHWTDATIDLFLSRKGNQDAIVPVGGVELKWWRRTDAANGTNRRRDLVSDFIRAGSLYSTVEHFAFVALLSTAGSWNATTKTKHSDKDAMEKLSSDGAQKWDLRKMVGSKAVAGAMQSLRDKVPIPAIFHTDLLCTRSLMDGDTVLAFAKVWKVKKLQNSTILTPDDLLELLKPKSAVGNGEEPVPK